MSGRWWMRIRIHARQEKTGRWDTIEFKLD